MVNKRNLRLLIFQLSSDIVSFSKTLDEISRLEDGIIFVDHEPYEHTEVKVLKVPRALVKIHERCLEILHDQGKKPQTYEEALAYRNALEIGLHLRDEGLVFFDGVKYDWLDEILCAIAAPNDTFDLAISGNVLIDFDLNRAKRNGLNVNGRSSLALHGAACRASGYNFLGIKIDSTFGYYGWVGALPGLSFFGERVKNDKYKVLFNYLDWVQGVYFEDSGHGETVFELGELGFCGHDLEIVQRELPYSTENPVFSLGPRSPLWGYLANEDIKLVQK